jgi:parallel beta-helix repeat protein
LVAFFAAIPFCSAATFYVSPTGTDSNPGSIAAPWATLQHAVDKIKSGDVVLVASGTYEGCVIGKSGSKAKPKTLRAAPGATVHINTPGPLNRHDGIIEIEEPDFTVSDWVIDGLEVANSPVYGIDVRVTDRITIQNNRVHGSGSTGIFTSFSNNILILNNESYKNGEHGIYQSNSSHNAVIRGNRSHDNARSGIHMNGDLSQGRPGMIESATVEENVIWENGREGGSGINCDGVDHSVIRANVLTNNHASGISLFGIDGAHSSSYNKVSGNQIVMAPGSRWVMNIPDDGKVAPPAGNEIQSNTLCTPDQSTGSILTWSAKPEGFVSDNNVVVDRFSADNGKTVLTLAQWQAPGYDKASQQTCAAAIAAAGIPK